MENNIIRKIEQEANENNLKYFRCWSFRYYNFLIENKLKHNKDLLKAYYNKVVLLK